MLTPFGIGRARFFINGVDTETQGVDTVLRYALLTEAAGRWNFTLSANWNSTDVTALPSTNVIPQGGTLFGRINVITFEGGEPDNKQSLMVDWDQPTAFGALGATLKATNYGQVTEPQPVAALDLFLGSAVVMDMELRARFGKGDNAAVGMDNRWTNTRPEPPLPSTPPARNRFHAIHRLDSNGRYLYARVGYNCRAEQLPKH